MADHDTRQGAGFTEYDDERDADAFWEGARLTREPLRQWWYLPGLALFALFSIPWYREAGEPGRIIGGLPDWVWVTMGCTFGMAALGAVAALQFWRDDER